MSVRAYNPVTDEPWAETVNTRFGHLPRAVETADPRGKVYGYLDGATFYPAWIGARSPAAQAAADAEAAAAATAAAAEATKVTNQRALITSLRAGTANLSLAANQTLLADIFAKVVG